MRALYIYNTASRNKERFEPLHDPVAMYCCGPTVYNYAHIGNLRTYIFEDILKRALVSLGYSVTHVVNVTDVGHLTSDADTGEDKMEKGAAREGKSVWEIASFFFGKFKENIHDLNIIEPDVWPKATEHISRMIEEIRELERRGFTYRTSDGIYFDTTKFHSYCDFARLDPANLRAGGRVEMGEKRAVTDFALWKFSPEDTRRQMEWESPWGIGFPGWHIECSAMSLAYLPQPIDIHCGGADHIRVHHTNEIAQAEAATGKQFVRYWAHGEFLVVDKGKMAKSGGNFVTLDALKESGMPALAFRMFCFTAHYRSPLTFSWEGVQAAAQSLENLRKIIPSSGCGESGDGKDAKAVLHAFYDAVYDDLNMPRALAALWEVVRDSSLSNTVKREAVRLADEILGLDLLSAPHHNEEVVTDQDGMKIKFDASTQLPSALRKKIVEKIRERRLARTGRDFQAADRIRNGFARLGITIRDLPDGTTECTVSQPVATGDENPEVLFKFE